MPAQRGHASSGDTWFSGEALQGSMLENHVAEICFDLQGSPVNKVGRQMIEELGTALTWLEQNSATVQGLLLTSGKSAFVVGADIDAFAESFAQPVDVAMEWIARGQTLFNRLEDLPFPSVAAICGHALGGGLELGLAATARVAESHAKLGQPEVKLGLIPGWGGTVRLPRLIGLDNALEMICGGDEVDAEKAQALGLVNAVVPLLRLKAAALAQLDILRKTKRWEGVVQQKQAPLNMNATELAMSVSVARGLVKQKAGKHYPAPLRALDTMEKTANLTRAAALAQEARAIVEMGKTPQCRALVGVFFADREVRKLASVAAKNAPTIERVGILGAGTMGGGIAYQCASRGVRAAVKDVQEQALGTALNEAGSLLRRRVQRGKMSLAQAEQARNLIFPSLHHAELENAQVIIEAVTENPEVKRKVLQEVESICAPDALIATNTSTIPLETLQDSLKNPQRFCGLHFFNPVPRMPLVEVIYSAKTSPQTLAHAVACAIKLGKVAIVVKSGPGFLVNRVLFPYLFAFQRLVSQGANIETLDKAMIHFGWPMGPAHLCDVVGLDVCAHAGKVMADAFGDRLQVSQNDPVNTLLNAGDKGKKTGRGFYLYSEDRRGRKQKQPDANLATRLSKAITGDASAKLAPEAVVLQLMLPMLNEASRCLSEGVVGSPVELDMALLYGLGFPPFCGGLLRWAEAYGLSKLVDQASDLASTLPKQHAALYAPTPQLQQLASQGGEFYGQTASQNTA